MLSFDQAPPFAAPFRFFLTAPFFALFAGVLLAVLGPEAFSSRWTPGALALTHLLAIGFLLQVMLGAMIQILPVVAGANLFHPLVVARVSAPAHRHRGAGLVGDFSRHGGLRDAAGNGGGCLATAVFPHDLRRGGGIVAWNLADQPEHRRLQAGDARTAGHLGTAGPRWRAGCVVTGRRH